MLVSTTIYQYFHNHKDGNTYVHVHLNSVNTSLVTITIELISKITTRASQNNIQTNNNTLQITLDFIVYSYHYNIMEATPKKPVNDSHGTKRDKTSPSHTSPNQLINPTKKSRVSLHIIDYKKDINHPSDTTVPQKQNISSLSIDNSNPLSETQKILAEHDSEQSSTASIELSEDNSTTPQTLSQQGSSSGTQSNEDSSEHSVPQTITSPSKSPSSKSRRSNKNKWRKPNNWEDLKFGADNPIHPKVNLLPIKVPLGPKFGEDECMHLLEEYISDQGKAGRKVKYVIEVSGSSAEFSNYTKESILEMGLKYFQVTTRPKTQISDDQVTTFISYIEYIFKREPESYVLVHCTHGVNRTGFYICSYLVRKLNIPVHIALAYFAISRQVALYDPLLIEHLFEMNNQTDSEMYKEARYPRFDADKEKKKSYVKVIKQRREANPKAQFKQYSQLDDHLDLTYYYYAVCDNGINNCL
jgi:hypothetical protein